MMDGGSVALGVMKAKRDHWKGEEHEMGEPTVASSVSIHLPSPLYAPPATLSKQTFSKAEAANSTK